MTAKKKTTRKPRPRTPTKAQKPAWVYVLTGLLIGLFIAGVVYVSKQPASTVNLKEEVRNTTRTAVEHAEKTIEKKKQELNDPEFFKSLPSLDNIPLDGLPRLPAPNNAQPTNTQQKKTQPKNTQPTKSARPPVAPVPEDSKKYIFQVGSFANFEHADEQKAQLILNNWNAFIKTATLDNGNKRFRVYVGEFNKQELAQTQARLAQMGIKKPLVLNAP